MTMPAAHSAASMGLFSRGRYVEDTRTLSEESRGIPCSPPAGTLALSTGATCERFLHPAPLMKTSAQRLEMPVEGMDCAGCARHVRQAIEAVDGVCSVEVLLAAGKAVVAFDPAHQADTASIREAIEAAGYRVPPGTAEADGTGVAAPDASDFGRRLFLLLGFVFGVVLFAAVAGEWLGLFESLQEHVPWPVGVTLVLFVGYPVFASVVRAALRGKIIAHTLMSVGAVAALAAGAWMTAAVVVFFMRVGDHVEHFTTERARRSLRALTAMAPRKARVERGAEVQEVPIDSVRPGDIVVVRPGEQIPVDGEVVVGRATVDQAALTGESMPVEAEPGTRVFAATIAGLGSLRVRATEVGRDTAFGQIIRMVEEAEAHRGTAERVADRFSAYYLPVVAVVAVLTYVLRQDVMATVAVLVVACSCAFALATPVAMLASIGAAARRGLLVKGGKYLEALARADVVLLDKTGTLTLGRPHLTDVVPLDGLSEDALLTLAASAEHDSEHPLAGAVREAAAARGLTPVRPDVFESLPGLGVRAVVAGREVIVGNRRAVGARDFSRLEREGKTLLYVAVDNVLKGVLAAADTQRPDVPAALDSLRALGIRRIELLTGDRAEAADALAARLGIESRAGLLPGDKIALVESYQSRGHTVVMIGDGVNDAPALAQADVGIAMGAGGTDVAAASAHMVLLREDWHLVPDLFRIARRTMRVVYLNIAFTTVYNIAGLTLAAVGLLPPILAAAAQALPDLGILANSARLIRQQPSTRG